MAAGDFSSRQWQVPEFTPYEFTPRKNEYCACVFVINENGRLHAQLKRMTHLTDQVDLVIADGGSTDGSVDEAKLGEFRVNTLLVKKGPGKLGAQMRMAFAWAMNRGYQGVVVVDGNNKDSVEDIPRFLQKLRDGYDHVQGSRFISGGYHENTPWPRLIGLRILHAPLLRMASGFPYTDTTNGFRAFSRRFLIDPQVAVFRDVLSGYELHYYLAIRAARLKFRCIEIPVTRKYPAQRKTITKISPIKGNLQVMHRLFSACLGRYNPP